MTHFATQSTQLSAGSWNKFAANLLNEVRFKIRHIKSNFERNCSITTHPKDLQLGQVVLMVVLGVLLCRNERGK
jgi:hypothetical protein